MVKNLKVLERGQIQELVTSKFQKRYIDGPPRMGTEDEDISVSLDIYQAPICNQADKKVHCVPVSYRFPSATPGFAQWASEPS